jgi:hypothetical protein
MNEVIPAIPVEESVCLSNPVVEQSEVEPVIEPAVVEQAPVEQPVQVRLNQPTSDSRFTNYDDTTKKYSFLASTLKEIETLVDKLGHLHIEVKDAAQTYLL